MVFQRLEIGRVRGDILPVVKLLGDDGVHDRVQHRDIAAGAELQHVGRMAFQRLAARVHDDQRRAPLRRLLEIGGGDGVVLGRVGADHDQRIGIAGLVEGGGDGPGADALEQRRHRGGVAEARAMVHIVGAEAGADQFLEEIGFLVRALGGAEAGERPAPMRLLRRHEPGGGPAKRLLPACLAEMRQRPGGIDIHALGRALAPDQRLRQPFGMGDVVEPEPALDAEPLLVGGAVAALDGDQPFAADRIGDLAADAAIGAHAVHPPVGRRRADRRLRHQRACGAGLHALAAGHAA